MADFKYRPVTAFEIEMREVVRLYRKNASTGISGGK